MRFRTATAAAALAAAAILGSAGSAFAVGDGNDDNDGNDFNRTANIQTVVHDFEDAMLTRISERSDNDSSVSSEYENETTNVIGNVSNDHSGARTGGQYFG